MCVSVGACVCVCVCVCVSVCSCERFCSRVGACALVRVRGACARAHREAGLAAVTGEHYEGGHWLGSFAVYLVTKRGL